MGASSSTSSSTGPVAPLRVLQFARFINRFDFIDLIVRHSDPARFLQLACTLRADSNIADTHYAASGIPHFVLRETMRLFHPLLAFRLACLLTRLRVDVLHAHHYDEALIGWLATRVRRTAFVVGRHYSDSIHVLPSRTKRRALLALEGYVNGAARRIVVPSSYVRDILTRRQGVAADKVALIPYGVDPEKYPSLSAAETAALRAGLGLEGRFVFGTFGRLDHQKGHRFLIEAMVSLRTARPDVLLLVVGEGSMRTTIEEQVRRADLGGYVRLLGWRRDALRLMCAVDAVVQPTLQEAFSQVMVEALWMGRPLVISDVGGVADIIKHGDNGLVVPPGEARALAQALSRLLAEQALCERLAAAGRDSVLNVLAAPKVVALYQEVYVRALAAGGS